MTSSPGDDAPQGRPATPPAGAPPQRSPGLVIARVYGIPVYVSPWWFAVAALLVYLYATSLSASVGTLQVRYLVSAAFVVLLYASVLVHELSHCVVARAFRLAVRRVLLYPLGGFSEIEEEPPTPLQEFLVSVAGPVLSLVLAAIAAGLTHVVTGGLPNLIIDQLFRANLLVGLFNLLPGLPLDGGRILRAGVWKATGRAATATIAAAWAGRGLAIAVLLVPLALTGGRFGSLSGDSYWLWLLFIAGFMWMSSGQAIRAARVRERLPRLKARTLGRRAIGVPSRLPLSEAVRRADEAQATALIVVDHDARPIALVNEDAVIATPEQRRPWVEIGAMARRLDPGLVLSADLTGMDLIEAVRATPASEYLLIEPSGQIYGVLVTTDLDRAFAGA